MTAQTISQSEKSIVIPGTPLGRSQDFLSGHGTYIHNSFIYSSLLGLKVTKEPAEDEKLPTLSILDQKSTSPIPEVGSIVTGQVIRILSKSAVLKIIMVGTFPCTDDFSGVIRLQDVRATEKDKVQIFQSFRPGDVVKAEVISLGDSKSYFLSTAKNELGVIIAQSASGETMIPISWQEMQCPKSKVIEFRKCAKPF